MANFTDVNFKYLDARSERLYSPDLLEEAFVDVKDRSKTLLDLEKYIIYGSKGSGKTALATFLELSSKNNSSLFVKIDELDDFDFDSLKTSDNLQSSFPSSLLAWKFLLMLRVLILMASDDTLLSNNPDLCILIEDLKNYGFLTSPDVSVLARETLKGKFTAQCKFFLQLGTDRENKKELSIKRPGQLSETIMQYLKDLKHTNHKYVLILDGTDHILRYGIENISLLSDLIRAAKGINEDFLFSKLDAKIVIILRDDLARLLPDPDLAKRLNDNGIFLSWYQRLIQPFQTDLFLIVKRRAELVGYNGDIKNIWHEWFPREVYGRPSALYFIERTRYLPRDLIGFLKAAQDMGKETPLDVQTVIEAEKVYSEWFYDELYDSLAGVIPQPVRESLSSIFIELTRYFNIEDLELALHRRGLTELIRADHLANILFESHWIGNYWQTIDGRNIYIFKSRSRSSGFSPHVMCVLQLGLIRGLNLNLSYKGIKVR